MRLVGSDGGGSHLLLLFTILFAIVSAYQIPYSVYLVRSAATVTETARPPFRTDRSRTVRALQNEAAKAGLHVGDVIARINKQSFDGDNVLDAALQSPPGRIVVLEVTHPDGNPHAAVVTLAPKRAANFPLSTWIVLIVLNIGLPALCLGLGFASVFLRIRNPVSWLLLALMISFSQLIVEPVWTGPFKVYVLAYRSIAEKLFGVWILLFAIFFPQRSEWDRRWPALKWIILVPLTAAGLVRAFDECAGYVSFSLVAPIRPYSELLRLSVLTMTGVAVLASLTLLALRERGAPRDEVRRVRLTFAGAALSLGPLLLILIASVWRGVGVIQLIPLWVSVPSVLMLAIFPATILYLVLVPRVLELRLVIREGLLRASAAQAFEVVRVALLIFTAAALFTFTSRAASPSREEVALAAYALIAVVALHPRVIGAAVSKLERLFYSRIREREDELTSLFENLPSRPDQRELADRAARGVMRAFGVTRVAVYVADGEHFRCAADLRPPTDVALEKVEKSQVVSICSRTTASLIYPEDARSWIHRASRKEQEFAETLQVRLAVPFVRQGTVLGFLAAGPKIPDQAFTTKELDLIQNLSRQMATGLDNCRLIAELEREFAEREKINSEREAAEQANQAKSAFIANMSHELRTPLNAILGYSEMLRESAEEAGDLQSIQDLDRVHSAGKHLLTLINSVLDISKIEAGKMDLYIEPVEIGKLITDVANIARPAIEGNGNEFVCSVSTNVSTVHADATKLRQILLNLLSNAGKFTKNGTVSLLATSRTDGSIAWLQFEVKDTGIGLTPEQMKKLFQPFVQADSSVARKYGGTGLGLVLSKRFCQMMGGDIELFSQSGVGSTFIVKLPVSQTRTSVAQRSPADGAWSGQRAVVASGSD